MEVCCESTDCPRLLSTRGGSLHLLDHQQQGHKAERTLSTQAPAS